MIKEIYKSSNIAAKVTDFFYKKRLGFLLTAEVVDSWLDIHLTKKSSKAAHILDLCCRGGVWLQGLLRRFEDSTLYGIDILKGEVSKAKSLIPQFSDNFVVGDAGLDLPWADQTFDLISTREPGLYNQHSMDRPATIEVIEAWHKKLKKGGIILSSFYADHAKFGTYTNPLEVALLYNRAPKLTASVDFTGGKYHSDVQTFLTPFWKATDLKILDYRFIRNNHILLTANI